MAVSVAGLEMLGHNTMLAPDPQHPLENLRPQVIYDALLIREIGQDDAPVLENGTETAAGDKGRTYERPDYILDVIQGHWPIISLARKIVFSRLDLLPNRQLLYDDSGHIVTDVSYSNYKDFDTIRLPSRVESYRPEEEYDITLSIVKRDLNQPLGDEKFVLEQPQGVQVIDLDQISPVPHTKN